MAKDWIYMLEQAFLQRDDSRRIGNTVTLEKEAKALERDEECDRPISIQFRAIVAISHKNRGKGEGDQRRQGTAINIELQSWRDIDIERERLPSYKIEYFQGQIATLHSFLNFELIIRLGERYAAVS